MPIQPVSLPDASAPGLAALFALGTRVGDALAARGETVAVAESSAGGLVSAALLARPGASAYYLGGAVVYTRRAVRRLTALTPADATGIRSSSLPWARLLARHQRQRFRATWAIAETGAAGPDGNPYGDPAGHTCLAVAGPIEADRLLQTGDCDRAANMLAFAGAALALLEEAISAAPREPLPKGIEARDEPRR